MKRLFAMLLALCMMCGAMVAGAEESAVQVVKVGKATFGIPAELSMTSNQLVLDGVNLAMWEGEQYSIIIETFDWKAMPYDLDNTSGDEHVDNFFMGAYLLFQDLQMANDMLGVSERLTFENGMVIIGCAKDGVSLVTRYEPDNGCAILVVEGNSTLTAAQGFELVLSVAASFRIDGVPEEDMVADTEDDGDNVGQEAVQKYIVIKNGTANIRSGPGSDHDRITTAKQGDTFPLLGEEGTWYMIEVNGQTAYVSKGLCEIKE